MKKLLTLSGAMMLAVGLLAPAAFAAGGGPKATGGVSWTTPAGVDAQASFNAQVDNKGNTKGTVRLSTSTGIEWSGTVTCYNQADNHGILTGTVDGSDPAQYFEIRVTDNSSGGSDPDNPDRINSNRRANPYPCATVTPATTVVTGGNLTVHQ